MEGKYNYTKNIRTGKKGNIHKSIMFKGQSL